MTVLLTAIAAGVGVGSVYALVALGYTFIVRTTGVFSFAQSPIAAYGGLFAYTLVARARVPVIPAAIATILAVGTINLLLERVAIRPLLRTADESLTWLLSTLGAGVLLSGIAERIWGDQPLGVPSYLPFSTMHLGSVSIASSYVLAFAGALVIAIVIDLIQHRTLWGKVLRALGENRHAVELAGVSLSRAGMLAFAFGGAIAGLGGFLSAPVLFAQANTGFSLAILAFAGLAIGGFGSHWGAILGGCLVGLVESIGATYLGTQYEDILVLGFLIVLLWLRPQGLAGGREAREV